MECVIIFTSYTVFIYSVYTYKVVNNFMIAADCRARHCPAVGQLEKPAGIAADSPGGELANRYLTPQN